MKNPLKGAVIVSQRVEVKLAVREELKAMGVNDIISIATVEEFKKLSQLVKNFLLIVDLELGEIDGVQVLSFCRSEEFLKLNPLIIIANDHSKRIISMALEYYALQTHSGKVTQNTIRAVLREAAKMNNINEPLKGVLDKVFEARKTNNINSALAILEPLFKKFPDNPRIACELADGYIQNNDIESAQRILGPMVEEEDPYVRALHLMGRCSMKKREYQNAKVYLEMAKTLSPHNISRLIELGHTFLHLDELDKAKKSFSEAIAINSENKEAQLGESQCLLMMGEINEGLALLQDISGEQELASVFNISAVLSIRSGRFEQGHTLYNSALNATKGKEIIQSRLMLNKGLAFKKEKNFPKAVECFISAIKLDSNYIRAKEIGLELANAHGIKFPEEFKPARSEAVSVESHRPQNEVQTTVQSTVERNETVDFDLEEDFSDDLDDIFADDSIAV